TTTMTFSVDRTPGTPATKIERTPTSTPGRSHSKVKEEKIFVTVRVRPLNRKELAHKDESAWHCKNDHTITFKHGSHAYNFDRVFGPSCPTERVYEEGAKDVALSALNGINATIFAYGQTSSGKTFTMRGITEQAIGDIYKHIQNNPDKDFVLKISALEIYNEVVKDLLNPESGPLRLLDDPEKGTIVEKLVEEYATDSQHLQKIIAFCEAQRQTGETALNDTSSRSHQIIRLTVESTVKSTSNSVKSLVANLNFVDLAGSERASQTNAEGARLKEGCHINRSLLTLSTVIRNLGGGKRSGHIPYRDSKLTRILQLSLGGNARTAIICTMSPALTHAEQSRNTLMFATRAKEVTNTAQVNMVISDKDLVKQLQKEVARLEAARVVAELHTPESTTIACTESLLIEKELKIQKMEMEMEELRLQRDLAQARFDELHHKMEEEQQQEIKQVDEKDEENKSPRQEPTRQTVRQSSTATLALVQEIRKVEKMQDEIGEDASRVLEALHKEIACLRLAQSGLNHDAAETIATLQSEIKEMHTLRYTNAGKDTGSGNNVNTKSMGANLKEEINRLKAMGDEDITGAENTIATLEEKLDQVQKSIDNLVVPTPSRPSLRRTRQSLEKSPCSPRPCRSLAFENENTPPKNNIMTTPQGSQKSTPLKSEGGDGVSSREGTPSHRRSSVNIKKMQKMFKTAAEQNIQSIRAYVTELKERVAKLQYQKQLLVCQVLELEANENADMKEGCTGQDEVKIDCLLQSPSTRRSCFEEQQRKIIELWDLCQVSIIHRTQFYLLFKGDSTDQIYMEVELRRLTWMQNHFAESDNSSPANISDDHFISLASSARALKRERELLAKRMRSRFTSEERE
ncbi:hypothetical protein KI387_034972, partial [Taxus chinensis]